WCGGMRGYSTDAVRRASLLALPLIALALWLWTSAELPPAPHVPAASTAFTSAQIDRGRDYRETGYLIILAALAAQLAVAWALAWRGRGLAARLPAGVAALAVAFVVAATALPFAYWLHRRAAGAGLDLRSDAAWLRDALLAAVIQAVAVAA